MKEARPRSTTIREVAAEAGVSTATVSRVLAGLDGAADEARERASRAVAKLNYHPNRNGPAGMLRRIYAQTKNTK